MPELTEAEVAANRIAVWLEANVGLPDRVISEGPGDLASVGYGPELRLLDLRGLIADWKRLRAELQAPPVIGALSRIGAQRDSAEAERDSLRSLAGELVRALRDYRSRPVVHRRLCDSMSCSCGLQVLHDNADTLLARAAEMGVGK